MTNDEFDKETNEHRVEVRERMLTLAARLRSAADDHDKSKLLDPERATFMEFTPKLKGSTYGSDEYKGFLKAMGTALDHHYATNAHHPEHYSDGIAGMTLMGVLEMLCDWKAATLRHADGDILKSIEHNGTRFNIPPALISILKNTIAELEWEGRDA